MRGLLWLLPGIALCAVSYADRVQRVRQAIEDALRIVGLSDEAAAITMELDPSHWSKQRPSGGVTGRLVALPPAFWRELFPRLGQIVNVPVVVAESDDDARARRLAAMLSIELKAMKAELRCESGETSSSAA